MSPDKQEILKRMGGIPEDIYDSICQTFYNEAKENLTKINTALSNSDFSTIARAAHSIKGSSANLFLQPIFESALKLEIAAKEGNLAQVQQHVQALQTLIK